MILIKIIKNSNVGREVGVHGHIFLFHMGNIYAYEHTYVNIIFIFILLVLALFKIFFMTRARINVIFKNCKKKMSEAEGHFFFFLLILF